MDKGMMDSWFLNHKSYELFHEAHVDMGACSPPASPNAFPRPCLSSQPPSVFSLSDGIGYDLVDRRLCSIDAKAAAEQAKSKHMQGYLGFRDAMRKDKSVLARLEERRVKTKKPASVREPHPVCDPRMLKCDPTKRGCSPAAS